MFNFSLECFTIEERNETLAFLVGVLGNTTKDSAASPGWDELTCTNPSAIVCFNHTNWVGFYDSQEWRGNRFPCQCPPLELYAWSNQERSGHG